MNEDIKEIFKYLFIIASSFTLQLSKYPSFSCLLPHMCVYMHTKACNPSGMTPPTLGIQHSLLTRGD